MAKAKTAVLDWVKNDDDDGGELVQVSGALRAPTRVRARSRWDVPLAGGIPKPTEGPLAVWEKRWASRVCRAIRAQAPATYLTVQPYGDTGSLSHTWEVSPPRMPGQGIYYFEDEHRNQSNRITVTTADQAVLVKRAKAGGKVAEIAPDRVELTLPLEASREIEIHHSLEAPATDPEVLVRLLLPGAAGEQDLGAAVIEYLRSLDLLGQLLESPDQDPYPLIEELSDGFLPIDPRAWDFQLEGAESLDEPLTVVVEPDRTQEVVVHISAPPETSRVSFAVSAMKASGSAERVLGPIIELASIGETTISVQDGPIESEGELAYEAVSSAR